MLSMASWHQLYLADGHFLMGFQEAAAADYIQEAADAGYIRELCERALLAGCVPAAVNYIIA